MKTLLTLFVLFFSSFVIADEELVGKQLICERNTERSVSLRGIEFIDEENYILVYGSYQVNSKVSLNSDKHTYDPLLKEIIFYTSNQDVARFAVYRDSLKLSYFTNTDSQFSCSIVDLNSKKGIVNIIEQVLNSEVSIIEKSFKEKNKI